MSELISNLLVDTRWVYVIPRYSKKIYEFNNEKALVIALVLKHINKAITTYKA